MNDTTASTAAFTDAKAVLASIARPVIQIIAVGTSRSCQLFAAIVVHVRSSTWIKAHGTTDIATPNWSGRQGPTCSSSGTAKSSRPGTAIDLAAGEGRNAIWLAECGWDATAVDYSSVAIDKARQIAERRGVEITTEVADLADYEPTPGGYDLVVIAYLQLVDAELAPILRRAADAVAPGGRMVLVSHDLANLEAGYGGPQHPAVLTTPDAGGRRARRSTHRHRGRSRRTTRADGRGPADGARHPGRRNPSGPTSLTSLTGNR